MAARMDKSTGKSTRLLELVLERARLKEMEKQKEKEKQIQKQKWKQEEVIVADLPKDIVADILIRLSLESLQSSRFVCKPWYNIINSTRFIETHLRKSEAVLIFLMYPTEAIPNAFRVNDHIQSELVVKHHIQPEPFAMFQETTMTYRSDVCMHFMEIKDGRSEVRSLNIHYSGRIIASCNGLLLLENTMKPGGVVIMNPVTRELLALPLGTLPSRHLHTFGLAFDSLANEYKVVHVYKDDVGYVSCEIINVGSRSWRVVNGPAYGVFGWIGYDPVFSLGALHWIPMVHSSEYILSMDVGDEKFQQIPLPRPCERYDGIVDMAGVLSFMNHVEHNQIDVWILKGLNGEGWIKQHSITVGCVLDMAPVGCSRTGEVVVFKRDEDNSLYAYAFEFQLMQEIETKKGSYPSYGYGRYRPHVNSLISWKKPVEANSSNIYDY